MIILPFLIKSKSSIYLGEDIKIIPYTKKTKNKENFFTAHIDNKTKNLKNEIEKLIETKDPKKNSAASCLFYGYPGTGKSIAIQSIADHAADIAKKYNRTLHEIACCIYFPNSPWRSK